MGFNLVRTQFSFTCRNPTYAQTPPPDIEASYIEGCHRMAAAMKDEGIYISISPFWAVDEVVVPESWGLPELTGKKLAPLGLIYFNPGVQDAYKAFCRKLYLTPNPYTGVPLARDPAVAMTITMNEDSMLFWTLQGMPMPAKRILADRFASWLSATYGSLAGARKAWDGATVPGSKSEPGDDTATGKLGLYSLWELTQASTGGAAKRKADQLRFIAETQRGFFAMIRDFYRTELQMTVPINPENWRTADDKHWIDLERWSYTAQDVMAKTQYFSGPHEGEQNGCRIVAGHCYADVSALHRPWLLPTNLKQVIGHPFINHETSWVNPNLYQSEGPFLVCAYQSLGGMDGVTWFAANDPGVDMDPIVSMPWRNNQKNFDKWTCLTPALANTFPAAALAYRRGDIAEGRPVVSEVRSLASLWRAEEPLIHETPAFDPNRDTGAMKTEASTASVHPLAYLVGPVTVRYGDDAGTSVVQDLRPFIDDGKKEVRSNTKEILMNYDIGFCTIDTARTQGATGFLGKASPIALGEVTLQMQNDYATVMVTSLDGSPLATAKRILVQTTTKGRPTGWTTTPAKLKSGSPGQCISDVGRMPWLMDPAVGTIAIRNAHVRRATALTSSGRKEEDIPMQEKDGRMELRLPAACSYVILSAP